MIPRFKTEHRGVGSVVGAQFGEDVSDLALTVSSLMKSCAAISLLAFPSAINRSTRTSAGVSASSVACSASW